MILPTQYLSPDHPPTSADDFIGGARVAARDLEKIIRSSIEHDYAPIKLFYSGPSGTGKTSLAYFAQHLLKVSPFALQEFNGTDVTIDAVRDLAMSLHLTCNELFGDYRLITIHEADRIPDVAQVRFLTLLDRLPKRTAIICTTNAKLGEMEKRFQRRFKFAEVKGALAQDIETLLQRWSVPVSVAKLIAQLAAGNVALALQEAEEWLQTKTEAA